MNSELAALATAYFSRAMAADPIAASMVGVPGHDADVPDLSEEHEAALAADLAAISSQAAAIDEATLDDEERITRTMLGHECTAIQAGLDSRWIEYAVNGMRAPHAVVLGGVSKVLLDTPTRAADYAERCRRLPGYLDQASVRLRSGAARGLSTTQRAVEQGLARLDTYLASPLRDDPLLAPQVSPGVGAAGWHDAVTQALVDGVRPAMKRLRDVIVEVVAPAARSDQHSGVLHLPGGAETYQRSAAVHTTTDLTAEQVHARGRELCTSLREEYGALGSTVFGTADFAEILDRLRHDPALRYTSAEEILADARGALRRAEEALPGWFRSTHRAPCMVEPMNALEAEDAVLGYYQPPAADGSRPGRHWINTYRPEIRTRYEYEALAFHESVPGHHLQFAVAQDLAGLPDFRRFAHVTAYGEGWALYTERLADEMGLYSGDLARFGTLSFDSWRASRLVVDTGLHAFGWTRDQAIEFMRQNTALTDANIANEVDRYIGWPGQALAYMIGRQEIVRIRDEARAALGARFDISDFHEVVLASGSIPLPALADKVTRWAAQPPTP